MILEYDELRRQFWFDSTELQKFRGIPHGLTGQGYRYYIDDWYPYNAQTLKNISGTVRHKSKQALARAHEIESIESSIGERLHIEKYREYFAMNPYPYQEEVIEQMVCGDRWLCAIEQGMGKTFMSYMSVLIHKLEGLPHRTLVVCPKIVLPNWIREVRENTDLNIVAFYGTPDKRAEIFNELQNSEWDMVVTTFDTIIVRNTLPSQVILARAWENMPDDRRAKYTDMWISNGVVTEEQRAMLLSRETGKATNIEIGNILRKLPDKFAPEEEIAKERDAQNAEVMLKKLGVDILIVDEASRCLSTKSQRSNVIERLANGPKKVFLLSGTLCVGRPTDIHEPCNILSRNILGMSTTEFNNNYVVFEKGKHHVIAGYKNIAELKLITDPYMITKTREGERLSLPDRLFETQYCVMPSEVVDLYDSIVLRDKVKTKGHTLYTSSLLTKLNKCQQVCGGFVYADFDPTTYCGECPNLEECFTHGIQPGSRECVNSDVPKKRLVVEFSTSKEEAFRHFVQDRKDLGEKFIVWAWYAPEIERIKKILAEMLVAFVTPETKGCVEQFNYEKTNVLAFVGQEKQGIGITLNAAKYTVYWSYGMDMEARLQSMDRNYRIGQKACTVVTDFVTCNTIEEQIIVALEHKEDVKTFMQKNLSCDQCDRRYFCEVCGECITSIECLYRKECKDIEERFRLILRPIRNYTLEKQKWKRLFSDLGETYGDYIASKYDINEKN